MTTTEPSAYGEIPADLVYHWDILDCLLDVESSLSEWESNFADSLARQRDSRGADWAGLSAKQLAVVQHITEHRTAEDEP